MKPPHRKGDSVTASEDTIAKTTDAWATEACYRNDVLQAVRHICHLRLPMLWSFTPQHVEVELHDRELPKYEATVLWALGKAVEMNWCRKINGRDRFIPCQGVKNKIKKMR